MLRFMESSSFVHLGSATLASLTYRTVFLVTLAAAMPISEVHALSVREDCFRRNSEVSITLLTFPGFVAKNRLPAAGAHRVTLSPLPEHPTLCPVSTLEEYLALKRHLRTDTVPLFLSLRHPSVPASPQLLSHWVRATIQAAYRWHPPPSSSRCDRPPEDVRSASMASTAPHECPVILGANLPEAPHPQPVMRPGGLGTASSPCRVLCGLGLSLRAYASAEEPAVAGRSSIADSPDLSRPAHELRALAASLALHRGTPYQEVVRAVGWGTASTFARFYMRHLGLADPVLGQPCSLPACRN